MKKILCVLAALIMLCLTACGENENYPLTVGQIKLDEAPKAVAALNANAADVMLNLGYAGAIVGLSDECAQSSLSSLSSLPSFGAAASPDIDAIIAAGVDTVIADETIGEVYIERLRDAKINVFRLDQPSEETDIAGFYRTVGLIMGGRTSGAKNAQQEYEGLYSEIAAAAAQIRGSSKAYTICYLSMDGSGNFTLPKKDSYIDKLLTATGSDNLTQDDSLSVEDLLKSRNPAYIFYDSQEVLAKLGSSAENSGLSAVTQGNCYEIPLEKISLVGISAAMNAAEIMNIMYPQSDMPVTDDSQETDVSDNTGDPAGTATDTPSETPGPGTDVSAQYGITLTDGMVIDENSDSSLITAIQQRFYDLGYSPSEPDGVFGSATRQYIMDFQYLNDFEVDGEADYEFLRALFSSNAVRREN